MMKRCKCSVIAFWELKTQWRCFVFFFLISAILLSALISIFSLTVHIPDEMNSYIRATGEGGVFLRADVGRLAEIEALPLEVFCYDFPHLEPESLNLPPELNYEIMLEDETLISLAGNVLHWMSEDRCLPAKAVNERLLSGRGVTEEDNARPVLWISDQAAALLHVSCGDSIPFVVDSAAAKPVSCEIAGIYRQDATLYAYYLTEPLYAASLDTVQTVPLLVIASNLRDYRNVIADLEPLCEEVIYSTDFVDSVMLLIYALYAICVFLCVLQLCILRSISKSYFHRRSQFFSVSKALGLQNRSILCIVCLVMQGLLLLSFFCAMLLAPLLSRYVVSFLRELFSDIHVPTNVWTPLSFLLLGIVSALLWVTCILSQRQYRSLHIVELIRRGDE